MKKFISGCLVIAVLTALVAIMVLTTSANSALTITEATSKGPMSVLTLSGFDAYCIERDVLHPVVGVHYTYTSAPEAEAVAQLEALYARAAMLDDGSHAFRAALQMATWAVLEPDTNFNPWLKLYCPKESSPIFNQLFADVIAIPENMVITVDMMFVEAEGYQTLVIPMVTMTSGSIWIPEETTEAPETTEPVPETTEAPETSEVPETTEAPETTEVPEEITEPTPETTEAPAETTETPETSETPETTEVPVEITDAPEDTTEPPEVLGDVEIINPETGDINTTAMLVFVAIAIVSLVGIAVIKHR